MCWQQGYFWNGKTMVSIPMCKSDPVPWQWHDMLWVRFSWGQWNGRHFVHETQHAAASSCSHSNSDSECLYVSFRQHVPDMSLSDAASESLCRCRADSVFPPRSCWKADCCQSKAWGCQSSLGGYVYLQELFGFNPCFPNNGPKMY